MRMRPLFTIILFIIWGSFMRFVFAESASPAFEYSPMKKVADLPPEIDPRSILALYRYQNEFVIEWYSEGHLVFTFWDGQRAHTRSVWVSPEVREPSCVARAPSTLYIFVQEIERPSRMGIVAKVILSKLGLVEPPEDEVYRRLIRRYRVFSVDLQRKRIRSLTPVPLRKSLLAYQVAHFAGCAALTGGGLLFFPPHIHPDRPEGYRFSPQEQKWEIFSLPEGIEVVKGELKTASDNLLYGLIYDLERRLNLMTRFRLTGETLEREDWQVPYLLEPRDLPGFNEVSPLRFVEGVNRIRSPGSIYEIRVSPPAFYYPEGMDSLFCSSGKCPGGFRGYTVEGESIYIAREDGIWEYDLKKAPWALIGELEEALQYPAMGSTQESLWVVGGSTDGKPSASAVRVDPKTGATKRMSDLLEARTGAAMVIWKDTPVVIGGMKGEPLRSVEIWDTKRGRWEAFPMMRSARAFPAAVVHNERIYVFGGFGKEGPLDDYEVYDPHIGWVNGGKLPQPLYQASATSTQDSIILAGGVTSDGSVSSAVYSLNVATGQWKELPPMTSPRATFTLTHLGNGHLLALFGWDGQEIANTYEVLRAGAPKWESFCCTVFPRYGSGSTFFGDRIYFAGGVAHLLGPTGLMDSFRPLPIYPPTPSSETRNNTKSGDKS